MELIILFGLFFALLVIGVPVTFCLGFSAVAMLLFMDISPVIAFQRMISGIDVFALLALPFFIYAIAADGSVSIASLFVAGLIPGIITGLCLIGVVYVISARRGYPREDFPGWRVLLAAFIGSLLGLMTAVIILGGVMTGVFTATESAAIAVFWAILVSTLVYRSFVPQVSLFLPGLIEN